MHSNDEQEKEEGKDNKNDINKPIPEENADIQVKDNNIESLKETQKLKFNQNPKTTFLNSIKGKTTLSSDYSVTEPGKPHFKHLYDNLQDFSMEYNLYKGIL